LLLQLAKVLRSNDSFDLNTTLLVAPLVTFFISRLYTVKVSHCLLLTAFICATGKVSETKTIQIWKGMIGNRQVSLKINFK